MKSSALIRDARLTITPRPAWTQWAFARDSEGCLVQPTAPSAVAWCAIGATMRSQSINNSVADAVYWLNKTVNGLFGYWQDKDECTHDEVLNAMDRAAILAETEGD